MQMRTYPNQTESFLYLMGIKPLRPLHLCSQVVLQPVSCQPLPDDMIDSIMKRGSKDETDLGILIATLRRTTAQLCVTADSPEELATRSWNAQRDIVLLSALLNCEAYWHIRSDCPAECFSSEARVDVITPSRLFIPKGTKAISESERSWLEANYSAALELLEDERFTVAVNALWSFRQNPKPSTQLAVLWSGIEALFGIQSELAFRISTLSSLFLGEGKERQSAIKKLYGFRSKAIHEGKQPSTTVLNDSAELLHALIIRCVEVSQLPSENELLFGAS